MKCYSGKSVYPGIAFGTVFLLQRPDFIIDESPAADPLSEWSRFEEVKQLADAELELLFEKTLAEIGEEEAGIIDVQRMILADEDFIETVKGHIMDEAHRAAHAVSRAGRRFSKMFADLDDPYMKARAPDIADAAQRMVRILLEYKNESQITVPSVIVADDLSPSETLQLDKTLIRAFVIRRGSANSHTAILARTLKIPSLIQADIPLAAEINGSPIAVDTHEGSIYLDPDEGTIRRLETLGNRDREEDALLETFRGLPSVTAGGYRVNLFVNIGGPEDLEAVLANDAEGIGLFRSEFLYLARDDFPGEDEQFAAYRTVAEGMKGRPVIIRTLDIGADKRIGYFGLEPEENPALGYRAIRICFDRPEIFKTQLRAIYRASAFGNISIMFPMIASLWELRRCKDAAAEAHNELAKEGIPFGTVPLGIMIETPAAALTADELAKEADFFSVGTNDLTQYTLAADRQNENLAPFSDSHHPAVLRLLQMTAESARRAGIWAGICGELASDPALTETFLEMGYTELSVSPGFVLRTRRNIRNLKTGGKK
ncbi:phosphoenolpyruvate-protein phosphotransferase [Spirochaetia bacterium]|nr:phosphoenolpyruvate-protein phosphotransferase [Spirochaetia bacterium]